MSGRKVIGICVVLFIALVMASLVGILIYLLGSIR
jgi:hypothetical protein